MIQEKSTVFSEFQQIPGVGKAIAEDLWNLGFRSISDLKGKDPEEMFENLCEFQGQKVDRCMLYVFRLTVYFAENDTYDPELLKWWNWKD